MGGMVTVALLHALMPTHWLPFSIVGRAQKWSLGKTLLVTAAGGCLHVLSTTMLGIAAVFMVNFVFPEERVHQFASLVLSGIGCVYIYQHFKGAKGHNCGHCSHDHQSHGVDRMAVYGLIMVPALSPCATTLPVFLAVASSGLLAILALCALLLVSTLLVQMALVGLSFVGAAKLKLGALERWDKLIVGLCLVFVAAMTLILHDHSHHHGHEHGHGHEDAQGYGVAHGTDHHNGAGHA